MPNHQPKNHQPKTEESLKVPADGSNNSSASTEHDIDPNSQLRRIFSTALEKLDQQVDKLNKNEDLAALIKHNREAISHALFNKTILNTLKKLHIKSVQELSDLQDACNLSHETLKDLCDQQLKITKQANNEPKADKKFHDDGKKILAAIQATEEIVEQLNTIANHVNQPNYQDKAETAKLFTTLANRTAKLLKANSELASIDHPLPKWQRAKHAACGALGILAGMTGIAASCFLVVFLIKSGVGVIAAIAAPEAFTVGFCISAAVIGASLSLMKSGITGIKREKENHAFQDKLDKLSSFLHNPKLLKLMRPTESKLSGNKHRFHSSENREGKAVSSPKVEGSHSELKTPESKI